VRGVPTSRAGREGRDSIRMRHLYLSHRDKLRSVRVFCSRFEIGGGQLVSHSLVGVSYFRTVQCRFRASLFRLVGTPRLLGRRR